MFASRGELSGAEPVEAEDLAQMSLVRFHVPPWAASYQIRPSLNGTKTDHGIRPSST